MQNILFAYRKLKNNSKIYKKENKKNFLSNAEILKKHEKNLEVKANTITIKEYVDGKGNENSKITIGGKIINPDVKKLQKIKIYKFINKELGNLKEMKKIKGKR